MSVKKRRCKVFKRFMIAYLAILLPTAISAKAEEKAPDPPPEQRTAEQQAQPQKPPEGAEDAIKSMKAYVDANTKAYYECKDKYGQVTLKLHRGETSAIEVGGMGLREAVYGQNGPLRFFRYRGDDTQHYLIQQGGATGYYREIDGEIKLLYAWHCEKIAELPAGR
jgi:hypothetical protein